MIRKRGKWINLCPGDVSLRNQVFQWISLKKGYFQGYFSPNLMSSGIPSFLLATTHSHYTAEPALSVNIIQGVLT